MSDAVRRSVNILLAGVSAMTLVPTIARAQVAPPSDAATNPSADGQPAPGHPR